MPGKKAPKLIDENMLDDMRPGSVVVDLAVLSGEIVHVQNQEKLLLEKGSRLLVLLICLVQFQIMPVLYIREIYCLFFNQCLKRVSF